MNRRQRAAWQGICNTHNSLFFIVCREPLQIKKIKINLPMGESQKLTLLPAKNPKP